MSLTTKFGLGAAPGEGGAGGESVDGAGAGEEPWPPAEGAGAGGERGGVVRSDATRRRGERSRIEQRPMSNAAMNVN
ncbi:hypothetical protein Sjap_013876 [Stephania japonica]|uniref:Uncharacterized protein n=1 Tax=Stephania japonica TaxID=461633 RepID=A0AAP0IYU0_9MAGN